MKRIVLVFGVLLLLAENVHAESPTVKGVYSLSGSVSYAHSKVTTSGDTSNTISVNPAGFYFIYPGLAIGPSIFYSDSKFSGAIEQKNYGVGPIVRYYVGKDAVLPFLSLEYLYTRSRMILASTSDFKGRGTNISLGIGVDYFISKNVALEPMVRYTFNHSDSHRVSLGVPSESSSRSEEFLIGMGINVFIF